MSDRLAQAIRNIPDFPKPGIIFKDITPIIGDPSLFREAAQRMGAPWRNMEIDALVAIESRGFLFGGAMAVEMNTGVVPVRKPGKLPCETVQATYDLEYGQDTLEIHADALGKGDKVLIVDDLLATGGSSEATARLVEKLGATVIGITFLIELGFLSGRSKIEQYKVESVIVE